MASAANETPGIPEIWNIPVFLSRTPVLLLASPAAPRGIHLNNCVSLGVSISFLIILLNVSSTKFLSLKKKKSIYLVLQFLSQLQVLDVDVVPNSGLSQIPWELLAEQRPLRQEVTN